MIALLLALATTMPPGRVVFVGEGAAIDAATCDELSAQGRIVLDASGAGDGRDPMEAAGPPRARLRVPADEATREIADAVLGAPCIVLAGGDAIDWYWRLSPFGHPTRLAAALREAHAGGANVIGAGASAPYLASWAMVVWADLGKVRRNPRRPREDVSVRGLGLVESFLVDSAACPRGDPARALRAAFDGFFETTIWLEGPVVLVADAKNRSATLLGGGSALVFDFKTARRGRDSWSGGRLSRLAAGDRWSDRRGAEITGSSRIAETVPGARVDAVRASLERVSASFSTYADERTRAGEREAWVDLAFDLAWDRNGS